MVEASVPTRQRGSLASDSSLLTTPILQPPAEPSTFCPELLCTRQQRDWLDCTDDLWGCAGELKDQNGGPSESETVKFEFLMPDRVLYSTGVYEKNGASSTGLGYEVVIRRFPLRVRVHEQFSVVNLFRSCPLSSE